MAAVTQLTPNFLGGVSRQTDDKKLDGQVVDIINGYPDPTYGLVKRASSAYLWTLNRPYSETPFQEGDLKDGFWFYAEREIQVTADNKDKYPDRLEGDVYLNQYLCCIKDGKVYVWDSLTGKPQPVFVTDTEYLKRPDGSFYTKEDFHYRTISDTTIICNRKKVVKMVDNTDAFLPRRSATIRLNTVRPETEYTVIIQNTYYTYTSETVTSADAILQGIKDMIPGVYNPEVYKTSVELTSTNGFIIDTRDSATNTLLNVYQDIVRNIGLLATPTKEGRLVEVIGDEGNLDDNYYLKFIAGQWTESVNPEVDVELDSKTMPHRLYINNQGDFQFGPIDYVDRLVGDDENNPIPSFVGHVIKSSFYYNNRLGFLSGSNVVLSQARDVYNFFARSQLATVDSDPIDVNANSTKPVDLYEVVIQPQGVLLFGTRQQFWLSAPETGVLTPTRSIIKSISNYESDINISPLDLGTSISFVSKTPDYSKLMVMQGQGSEVDPIVVEISKVVTGWLPNTITRMAVSPQNSFVALSGADDSYVYIYKFYNDGKEDQMQAWAKWEMPGKVQALNILNDVVFAITMQGNRYCASWVSINSLDKSGPQFSEDELKPGGPYLDFLSKPKSIVLDTNGDTIFYTKFPLIDDKKPQVVITLPFSERDVMGIVDEIDLVEGQRQLPRLDDPNDPGYYMEAEQGEDSTGTYFKVRGDYRSYATSITLGYPFDYEVTLPKFYFKLPSKSNTSDYTAHLNINRVKFAVGLSGAITFKLKAKGSDEWVDIQHVTDADYYEADMDPIQSERLFTVPIHQRNTNFQLKVTSDLPFPVSLVSMMWEGQYTPRFYRRT